jgi:phosphoglycerate dehydrogenase-like enzyme
VRIVKERFPGVTVLPYPVLNESDESRMPAGVQDVDVIAAFNAYPYTIPKIRKLKWFHIMMTGYEHVLESKAISPDVQLTTSAGTVSIPVAEAVMGYLLFFVKKFRASLENQKIHKMDRMLGQMRELHRQTLGILGLGHLGKEIARKAKLGFDMKVVAMDNFVTSFEFADEIHHRSNLDEILKRSDFLVISLPLTMETTKLIGERELRLMKPTAYLVNIARGEILDKMSFSRALAEGWIAGAGIDVFWGDPTKEAVLDKDDPLWDFQNLLITAHNATGTDRYIRRTGDFFCDNLERFMRGQALVNLVTER